MNSSAPNGVSTSPTYDERIGLIRRELYSASQAAAQADKSSAMSRYIQQVDSIMAKMQREIDMARFSRDDYHRMRDDVWREKEQLRIELAQARQTPGALALRANAPPLPVMVPASPRVSQAQNAHHHNHRGTQGEQYQSLENILVNNNEWRSEVLQQDPQFFERLSRGQTPEFLFIGCSDSRVAAELLTGAGLGELFVHRNIANLVVNTDASCLSVIQYAVCVLKVNHIIVCGHYECGGVRAALDAKPLGLIDNWLRNIQDVYRLHKDELDNLLYEPRVRRLVELSCVEQVLNVYKTGFVQQAQRERNGFPKVHGLVFDLKEGRLKRLDVDIKGYLRKYAGCFTYKPADDDE